MGMGASAAGHGGQPVAAEGAPQPLLPNGQGGARKGEGWLTTGSGRVGTTVGSKFEFKVFRVLKITKVLLELDKIIKIIFQEGSLKKNLHIGRRKIKI